MIAGDWEMVRNGRFLLVLALLIAGFGAGHAQAALIVDARIDGLARYCASAANFSFRLSGATQWRCGTSNYSCWSDPVHLYFPDDRSLIVDCTTTRPPWATDPLPGQIFGSGFE